MATSKKLDEIMAELAVAQAKTESTLAELSKTVDHVGKHVDNLTKNVEHVTKNVELVTKNVDNVGKEVARVTKNVNNVTKNVGGLNNSIGEITEMIVIPGLKGKMAAFNHVFTMASVGKTYSKPDRSELTEVDLLLENCEEVMIVEVKTQLSIKWLNKFLKKLELLRKHESITGMTGKTMYAAIAGIGFEAEARELAVEKGMYIIEIEEDDERVNVIPPAGKAGTW